MKKIFSTLLAILMVLSLGATTFANEGTQFDKGHTGNTNAMTPKTHILEIKNHDVAKVKPDLTELNALRVQILSNKTTIVAIKVDIRQTHESIIAKIKELKNDGSITEEQIAQIKSDKQNIHLGRETYKDNHFGVMEKHRGTFKDARHSRNIEAAKAAMEDMIAEQKARITDLNKILDNLKVILADLNKI